MGTEKGSLGVEKVLLEQMKTLAGDVWSLALTQQDIKDWLKNFEPTEATDNDRLHALHLLSHFNYVGEREVRALLRSAYRDLFAYPIRQTLRRLLLYTKSPVAINSQYQRQLENTHFLGVGGPAASGQHLLYYFRQENNLTEGVFADRLELLAADSPVFSHEVFDEVKIRRIVYVDDLLGSGEQMLEKETAFITSIRKQARDASYVLEVSYLALFAKQSGIDRLKGSSLFDHVGAVHVLDGAQEAFSDESRVYTSMPTYTSRGQGRAVAQLKGEQLVKSHPLGWNDGQLLLAFAHNTPDNSLPIFWWNKTPAEWKALFPRTEKI